MYFFMPRTGAIPESKGLPSERCNPRPTPCCSGRRPPTVYFRMCVAYNFGMTRIVEAIYAGGVLEPLESLDLPERQRVRLIVQAIENGPMGERDAAFARFLEGVRSMGFCLNGPLPTRDELHER